MELATVQRTLATTRLNEHYRRDVELFERQGYCGSIAENVARYIASITKVYKPATVARKKQALKAAIKAHIGHGLTLGQAAQINTFFAEIKTPKPSRAITQEKTCSLDELRKIIDASGKKTALIIRALYVTACRVSELCTIRLADCETIGDAVAIRILGKGQKERVVYMRKTLFDEIRKEYNGAIYLFERNGKPLSRMTVHTLIRRAGKAIGRKIHPHTIRHSFATNRLNELGIDTVAAYLGHASTATTAQYYLHNKPRVETVLSGAL